MAEDKAESAIEEAAKDAGKVLAKEVYQDGLQPAIKRVGNTLGALAGVMDTVFSPLRLLVYALDTKEALLKERIGKVLHERNVPPERVIPPDVTVAGPALQAMVFAADAAELRDMYAALLATAMDSETARNARPAFVEVLRQLTPDEARIVRWMALNGSVHVYSLLTEVKVANTDGPGWRTTHKAGREDLWLIGQNAGCAYLDLVPSYMDNIFRLGIASLYTLGIDAGYKRVAEFIVPKLAEGERRPITDATLQFEDLVDTAYSAEPLVTFEEMKTLLRRLPTIAEAVEETRVQFKQASLTAPLYVSPGVAGEAYVHHQTANLTHFGRQFCAACVIAEEAQEPMP